jgi:hypothetical protein
VNSIETTSRAAVCGPNRFQTLNLVWDVCACVKLKAKMKAKMLKAKMGN